MHEHLLQPAGAQGRRPTAVSRLCSEMRLNRRKWKKKSLQGFHPLTALPTYLNVLWQGRVCHLTTCRLLAPRNPRNVERRGLGDAPISVRCLVIDILGCPSKFYRTNPAKDTLFAYLLGQAGMLDDTGIRYVLLCCYFQVFGIIYAKLFITCVTQQRRPNPGSSSRLTTSFE